MLEWVRCGGCQFTLFKATPGFQVSLGPDIMEIRCKRCDRLNSFGGAAVGGIVVSDGQGGFLTHAGLHG